MLSLLDIPMSARWALVLVVLVVLAAWVCPAGLAAEEDGGPAEAPAPSMETVEAPGQDEEEPGEKESKVGDPSSDPQAKAEEVDYAPRVAEIVELLTSEKYAEREKGTAALEKLSAEALPTICRAYRRNESLELRARIESATAEIVVDHLGSREGAELGFIGIGYSAGLISVRRLDGKLESELTAYITEVLPETPAAEAGLRGGDELVAVDGENVASLSDAEELAGCFRRLQPGTKIRLVVRRGGRRVALTVVVGNRLRHAPATYRKPWRRAALRAFWREVLSGTSPNLGEGDTARGAE